MVSESKIKQKAIKFDKMSYDRLQKALDVASSQIDDLSYPLNEIGERFLRERSFIFDRTRSSAGAYEDLSERYKKFKQKKYGFIYPILFRTGRLKTSITSKGGENVFTVGPKTLEIGTTVPYAHSLQHGKPSRNLPARSFLFFGPESPRFATDPLVLKQNRANAMTLLVYTQQVLGRSQAVAIKDSTFLLDKIFF